MSKSHLSGYTPGIYEWLVADCGAVSSEEVKDYLNGVMNYDTLDEPGSRYFKLFADKYRSVTNCYLRKIMRERVRLAKESPL